MGDLTPKQQLLAKFMSDISEKCYCAGWMHNLEYTLWKSVLYGEMKYGRDIISSNEISELIRLAKECNSWIIFDELNDETAIELSAWELLYEKNISTVNLS